MGPFILMNGFVNVIDVIVGGVVQNTVTVLWLVSYKIIFIKFAMIANFLIQFLEGYQPTNQLDDKQSRPTRAISMRGQTDKVLITNYFFPIQ